MKKILHITNWYPNEWNDIGTIFVIDKETGSIEVPNE